MFILIMFLICSIVVCSTIIIVHQIYVEDKAQKILDSCLNELAFDKADSIAKKLISLKIRGDISKIRSCPIAVYLRTYTGDNYSVTSDIITRDSLFFADTPANIGIFIRNFDNGLYPELIRKKEIEK